MSNRETCHGCDGKGWVLIITSERVVPFFSRTGTVAKPGETMTNRDYGCVDCPICHGEGVISKKGATLADVATSRA